MPPGTKYIISNVVYYVFGRGLRNTCQLVMLGLKHSNPITIGSCLKKLYTVPNDFKKVFQKRGSEINDKS